MAEPLTAEELAEWRTAKIPKVGWYLNKAQMVMGGSAIDNEAVIVSADDVRRLISTIDARDAALRQAEELIAMICTWKGLNLSNIDILTTIHNRPDLEAIARSALDQYQSPLRDK